MTDALADAAVTDRWPPVTAAAIGTELARALARTLALVDLPEADQWAQHSPLMSPMVWDLAHIGNYEELWLLRELDGRGAVDPALDDLYNAFEHPRWERPSLPILGPTEARAYNDQVRAAVLDLLPTVDLSPPGEQPTASPQRRRRLQANGFVYGMVIQHEHQHDETLLATRQLMGDRATPPPGAVPRPPGSVQATGAPMRLVDGGTVVIGTAHHPWAYDNERDAHEVEVAPFLIDTTAVTNAAYLAFVDGGGYDDERLWSPAGWAWRQREAATAPLFWRHDGAGAWAVLRFGSEIDLDDLAAEPVQHVSFHEAEAFCRWAGKRLPTEAEWEAAAGAPAPWPWGGEPAEAHRANLGQRHAGPAPVGSHPDGDSPFGVAGMIGDVWEWTASDFRPHPGFEAFPYEEYSAVFWGSEYKVLKGGSWATDPVAVRVGFRNWDYPIRRQIFSGFRAARDA